MQTRKRIWVSAAVVGMAVMLATCGGKKEDATSSVHDYTYVSLSGNEYSGTYTGDWENGQPNGQCRCILKTETFTQTYSGDYFYGEWKGNGNLKVEYPDGTISTTYDGEFRDGKWNGSGEETYYYIAEEAAEQGYDRRVYKGQFSDDVLAGETTAIFYYTSEFAEADGGITGLFVAGTGGAVAMGLVLGILFGVIGIVWEKASVFIEFLITALS